MAVTTPVRIRVGTLLIKSNLREGIEDLLEAPSFEVFFLVKREQIFFTEYTFALQVSRAVTKLTVYRPFVHRKQYSFLCSWTSEIGDF